ncbi:MAG: heme o synthase [Haloarculaceae archaeon]
MSPTTRRFETLLAAATIGVYVLVVAGATASIADAVEACSTWPLCAGPFTLAHPALLIAVGHRVLAVVVGVLVAATAAIGIRRRVPIRVRSALLAALVLFPVQVVLGAFVVTIGPTTPLRVAHLLVGLGIFSALVLALAWTLEREYGDRTETGTAFDVVGDGPTDEPVVSTDEPTADEPVVPTDEPFPLADRVRAYVRLTKPRLMWLLCLVAAAAMTLAAGPALSPWTVALTLGGGVLAIGASGTFNHVLERDVDRRMNRTSDRPLATHRIPARNAVTFGVVLTVASLALFGAVNLLAAALGFVAIVFYSVVYTLLLKPNTVQNTVIGGFAGALPALIGWAAVTGSVGVPALVLAGVIFLWTPAHFYNLALAYRDDYARGGFPMMPVVRGETETRKHIVWYLAATFVAAVTLAALTSLGWLYAATITLVGGVFLWAVLRLHRERTDGAAFRAFHASNAYLGALLLAVIVDALAV